MIDCRIATLVWMAFLPPLVSVAQSISIDGKLDDWPRRSLVEADGQYLYVRLYTGRPIALQSDDQPFSLFLDLDGKSTTGTKRSWHGDEFMGAEVEVRFSPPARSKWKSIGLDVISRPTGSSLKLLPGDIGLMFAPTYQSDQFELRISRKLAEIVTGKKMGAGLRGLFVVRGSGGSSDRVLETFELDQLAEASELELVPDTPPASPQDAVRVVSYNVKQQEILKYSESFARTFRSLEPDVVLLQEWPSSEAPDEWFQEFVGKRWQSAANFKGVAIVTSYPYKKLTAEDDTRAVLAQVETPLGPIVFGSLHFKCCGGSDGREEKKRRSEAQSLNRRLSAACEDGIPAVVGGDFNLVGTRRPLELLAEGLDNKRRLAVAPTPTYGDRAIFTWRDHTEGYSPGRLDWILFTSSKLRVGNGYTVDFGALSDESLQAMNVERRDTQSSDHLPVVVDFTKADSQ